MRPPATVAMPSEVVRAASTLWRPERRRGQVIDGGEPSSTGGAKSDEATARVASGRSKAAWCACRDRMPVTGRQQEQQRAARGPRRWGKRVASPEARACCQTSRRKQLSRTEACQQVYDPVHHF